jgi:hypothetical protein
MRCGGAGRVPSLLLCLEAYACVRAQMCDTCVSKVPRAIDEASWVSPVLTWVPPDLFAFEQLCVCFVCMHALIAARSCLRRYLRSRTQRHRMRMHVLVVTASAAASLQLSRRRLSWRQRRFPCTDQVSGARRVPSVFLCAALFNVQCFAVALG